MELHVHTPGLQAEEDSIREQISHAIKHYEERLTRVDVFVRDVNGAKGGVDKHCVVEARPRGLDPVTADAKGADAVEVATSAAQKMSRLLQSKFGQLDDHRSH